MSNEKTKNGTVGTLWVVNYKFVTRTGAIRNASFIVTAKDTQEANEIAIAKVPTLGVLHPKLNSVKPWD